MHFSEGKIEFRVRTLLRYLRCVSIFFSTLPKRRSLWGVWYGVFLSSYCILGTVWLLGKGKNDFNCELSNITWYQCMKCLQQSHEPSFIMSEPSFWKHFYQNKPTPAGTRAQKKVLQKGADWSWWWWAEILIANFAFAEILPTGMFSVENYCFSILMKLNFFTLGSYCNLKHW